MFSKILVANPSDRTRFMIMPGSIGTTVNAAITSP